MILILKAFTLENINLIPTITASSINTNPMVQLAVQVEKQKDMFPVIFIRPISFLL